MLAIRRFVKYFFALNPPNIPKKSRRGKKTNSKAIAKRYVLQADEINVRENKSGQFCSNL